MKADIFLSVRNSSSRLPGKALLEIGGKTLTDHLTDRLKLSKNFSQIIICTSSNQRDDVFVEIAQRNNVQLFRGSEQDKLDRYLRAAKKFHTKFIVVVDGDDVFCDPNFIDLCITKFEETNADYISMINAPIGTIPFCMKTEALEIVCKLKNGTNTELWTGCFTDYGLFDIALIEAPRSLSRPTIRLTLDYIEDFVLIKKIFDTLYRPDKIFSLKDIIALLDSEPELLDINRKCQQDFLKNQKAMPKVRLNSE